ncbi:hypothetical protein WJX73_009417 [Symbiochloris irregularis]|uniref:F-box domain-containing protein n=1 Tax=Symbiochloris irregularis TaxID=706552 RepID=A0AAW1P653_9CHLO
MATPQSPPVKCAQVEPNLASHSLQSALACHTLPLLSLHDLARLASTCATLRTTVDQQDELWRSSAVAHLPAMRAQLQAEDRAGVQRIMQRRAKAVKFIRSGQAARNTAIELLGSVEPCRPVDPCLPRLLLSDDGRLVLCQTEIRTSNECLTLCKTDLRAADGAATEAVWEWLVRDLVESAR